MRADVERERRPARGVTNVRDKEGEDCKRV